MNPFGRPGEGEMAAFYQRYIDACPGQELLEALNMSWSEFAGTVAEIPESQGNHRYAEGKWTVKELLQHVIDTERVMAYRALRFARADATPLPGFEEDDWGRAVDPSHRSIRDMLAEAEAQRRSTILFFMSLPAESLLRSGTANGKPCTARAAGWIIAGHMAHHMRILTERYLDHGQA